MLFLFVFIFPDAYGNHSYRWLNTKKVATNEVRIGPDQPYKSILYVARLMQCAACCIEHFTVCKMILYDPFDDKCDIIDKYVMEHDNFSGNVGPISVVEIENLAYKVLSHS